MGGGARVRAGRRRGRAPSRRAAHRRRGEAPPRVRRGGAPTRRRTRASPRRTRRRRRRGELRSVRPRGVPREGRVRAAATRRREPLRARFERPLRTTFARPSKDRRKRRRLGPQSLLRPRARGEAPPRGDHPERGSVVVRAHVPRGGGAHHRAPPSPPRARDASAPRNARKIPRRLAARAQPQPPRRAPRRPPGHHAVPGAPGGGPERAPDAPRRDRLEASVPGDARRGREPITTRRRVVRGASERSDG